MSAQEFKVGQRIIGRDYTRLPVGAKVNNVWEKVASNDWRNTNFPDQPHTDDDLHNPRPLTYLPDAAEPEDKDDLYVEPEPLKEGDWVQVWARFGVVDEHVPSHVELPMPDGRVHDGYVRPDAIVRPDAGQVPPWLEAEKVESEAIANIAEVLSREGDMDYDAASPIAASLYRAGVRITEGGAS